MTDEERREVAARLRVLASHREVDKEMFHDAIGVWPGGCIDGYDPVGVMELADLIEPEERTCTVEHWGGGTFYLSCGHAAPGYPGSVLFCPNCGAKVVCDA